MDIPPKYSINSGHINLITRIESLRLYLSDLQIPDTLKLNLRKHGVLKSALYSARIEGNPLTIEEIDNNPESIHKKEVENIYKGIGYIENTFSVPKKIIPGNILALHEIVMDGLASDLGRLRHEPSAIFNEAGVAVYLTPAPEKLSAFMDQLLKFANSDTEKFPLIKALMSHLIFEKIHPFIDGNGRVGRLFVYMILKSSGWDFPLFVPFEEYLDNSKSTYYYHLDKGMKNPEKYLEFMLSAFFTQAEKIKAEYNEKSRNSDPLLPPRQLEIYNIVKDHKIINFDFLRRRFLKVPQRTLRYDVKKLIDKGFLDKIGDTRGAYYSVKKNK